MSGIRPPRCLFKVVVKLSCIDLEDGSSRSVKTSSRARGGARKCRKVTSKAVAPLLGLHTEGLVRYVSSSEAAVLLQEPLLPLLPVAGRKPVT